MEIRSTSKVADSGDKILQALKAFEVAPDCARVALPVVCAVASRSPASVWRDVKAGRLPAPVKMGPNCSRWIVGDLRRALATKEAA
ncbi:MAG: transcriptional regulator [Zoogloea sp.]|nr:transcriptional regulator [Zoogloea sp.]MCA0185077.1 transcriptional regulator [Pseudomonadota bacterium]